MARSSPSSLRGNASHRLSKEYLEGVLECMQDILVLADADGRVDMLNAAASKALGCDREWIGLPLADLFLDPLRADLSPERIEAFAGSADSGATQGVLRGKAGAGVPVLLTVSALKDAEGRPCGYVALAKDVSERDRDAKVLQAAKCEAEASSRELEAFSYSVAHDLRAPLRAVDGFSQVLLERYADRLDEQGKDYLKRVRCGSRKMSDLIDDLLNLSRVTRGAMKPEPVNLSALAEDVAADLRRSGPARAVEFAVAPGLTARGDANLLRVVLVNLLENAWKYTGKHPSARIEFGATSGENGERIFFVRDDGAGFDMAFYKRLFLPFSRVHGPGEFDGNGIGLATVLRVILRHHGRIWAEAAVEKGATFYFTLGAADDGA